MATPSPSSSPSSSPKPLSAAAATATKKPQPLPWTHQETVHLIQAYQEKWYSLKRGQLKANQWEEVAVTVAARCGYHHSHPSKTSTQCRHKMEKLRKRYRSELQRLPFAGASSSWQYFDLMDSLDRGPLPISARPLSFIPKVENNNNDDDDDDEEEEEEEDENKRFSKSRSINYILRRPTMVNRFAGDQKGVSGFSMKKRSEMVEADDDDDDDEGEVVVATQRGGVVSELAKEVRAFAERLVMMENMKIEMMRESERCRMEMESKRTEMILQSQQKILDTIENAFGGARKKLKVQQES